ncbi:hypothetical protein [Sphingosinicella sp. YJ22]|nr:hypothetical protein [Sphingosinicella sp. YJ22]
MAEKQERFPSKAPQEELIPGKTQNLSSATRQPGDAHNPTDQLDKARR